MLGLVGYDVQAKGLEGITLKCNRGKHGVALRCDRVRYLDEDGDGLVRCCSVEQVLGGKGPLKELPSCPWAMGLDRGPVPVMPVALVLGDELHLALRTG